MVSTTSPYSGIEYGWDYGEDGWNSGMDLNLLRLSFLDKHYIDAVVGELPSDPAEGYSCLLTTDNLVYFYVNGEWMFVDLPEGYEFNTAGQERYSRVPAGIIEIPSTEAVYDRVVSVEADVSVVTDTVRTHTLEIEDLQQTTGGIEEDASNLSVTSDDETKELSEWMEYVRDRENHTGVQDTSSISNFTEQVVFTVDNQTASVTLDISSEGEDLSIENKNSLGGIVETTGGVLTLPEYGSVRVNMTEDITEVIPPEGDIGAVKVVYINLKQASEGGPYNVLGWGEDISWMGGVPSVTQEPEETSLVVIVNIGNTGWVGWQEVEREFVASDIQTSEGESVQQTLDALESKIDSVVAGDGVLVDNTDPNNPVVSVDDTTFDPAGTAEGINTSLTNLINERMSSAARDAVDTLDPATATLEDLITALQLT